MWLIISCRRFEQALEEGDSLISSVDEVSKQVPGHKHVGRQLSFNLVERSLAVRVAMIELQEKFDCVEGASHVTAAVGGSLEQRYDYMVSLFKHVDALATLLLFWKSKAAGIHVQKTYFISDGKHNQNRFKKSTCGKYFASSYDVFYIKCPQLATEYKARNFYVQII